MIRVKDKTTCAICGKEVPRGGVTIVLRSQDGIGKETILGAVTTCTGCHAKIVTEDPSILECSIKAMISSGEESYLATYCKHLERRLRDLEIETNLKDADMAKMESDRDDAMDRDHAKFLERIIANCKSCSSLFARKKDEM